MAQVRPVGPDEFEIVHPLLLEFGPSPMTREDWRRMLFDLPWPVDEPHRGYLLTDGGQAVGFLGTIFSERLIAGRRRRFCNLSSWIVRESHRTSSMQLLFPVLALKSHTILNWSASVGAHEIFRTLGFATLEDRQVLMVPVPSLLELARWPASRILHRDEQVREHLGAEGRRICDDMHGTLSGQVLLTDGARSCHVIATRSRWKGRATLAHVRYASDWGFLRERLSLASWGLGRRLGTVGLRLDGRHAVHAARPIAVRRALALPPLYRPAEPDLTPTLVDALYSEVVNMRW